MFPIPGKHLNSVCYVHNQYSYNRDPRGAGLIFRCSTRSTNNSTAVIYLQTIEDMEHQPIEVYGHHNHAGDPLLLLRHQFNTAIKARARERAIIDEPKTIFDSISALDE